MLMCLPLLMAGCKDGSSDDKPVNPDPEIPGENASDYVEFKSNMVNFTRANVDETNAVKAKLYAWTKIEREVSLNNNGQQGKAFIDQVFYTAPDFNQQAQPAYVSLSRSKEDPTLWDYKDKVRWSMFQLNPVSFLAFIEPDECRYGLEYYSISKPHSIARPVKEKEYDATNKEYYYRSGDLTDIMVAYTRNCKAEDYEGKQEVELNFQHLFPRVILTGRVDDELSLEVKVKEAYIYGLQTQATYRLDTGNSFNDGWTSSSSPLTQYIEMEMPGTIRMNAEPQPLVASGREPHVIPQKVKAWTAYALRDGAGIILTVNIRNTHDNSWIVGSDNEYEYVYVPFPLESLEAGKQYYIDILFGALYRDNGTPFGYQLSYQPEIVEWDTEEESVELKR